MRRLPSVLLGTARGESGGYRVVTGWNAARRGCAPSRHRGRRASWRCALRALGPFLTAALVASILAAQLAHARFGRVTRVVRTTCRDGVAVAPFTEPGCDWDLACDDTCTFAFFCLELCEVNPPPGSPTFGGQLAVPVGHKKVIKRGQLPSINVTKFILRCRRHPPGVPCPTTTTTMPCPATTTAADRTCSPPVCGNGVRDVGEQCDGADLACGTLFNAGCVPPGLPNECQCCGLDGALCVNGFGCCPGYPCVSNGGPLGLGSCAAPGSCGSLHVVCGFSGLPCCPGLACAPPNGFPDYPYTFCCEPPGASCTGDLDCCVGTCAGGVCS